MFQSVWFIEWARNDCFDSARRDLVQAHTDLPWVVQYVKRRVRRRRAAG